VHTQDLVAIERSESFFCGVLSSHDAFKFQKNRVSGAVVCGLIRQVWHRQNAVKNVNVSLFILKILCLGLTNCTNNIDFDSCKLQPYRPKHVRKGF